MNWHEVKSIADWLMRLSRFMGCTAHWLPALASRAGFVSVGFRSDARTSRTPVFFRGLKSHEELGPGVYSGLQSGSAGWAEIIDAPVLFINNTTTCEHCAQQLAGAH
jgi:hypothetical protein